MLKPSCLFWLERRPAKVNKEKNFDAKAAIDHKNVTVSFVKVLTDNVSALEFFGHMPSTRTLPKVALHNYNYIVIQIKYI